MDRGTDFSVNWYRVAELRPRLRPNARLHRHRYRGQIWYVLEDGATGRFHRFTPAVHAVLALMDGRRKVEEIWSELCAAQEQEAPTQDELIQLLSQLHLADLLQSDVPPDTRHLLQMQSQRKKQLVIGQLTSPLFWRIPLFDPDRFLAATLPLARRVCSLQGALLWLLVVGLGFVLGAVHWQDLAHDFVDRVLTPNNILVAWLLFPIIKLLHEFGHAYATKVHGGEVHEMGVMFLVFVPVPYVDASSASAFVEKRRRLFVGAAGMVVETFFASIALIIWLNVEQGAVRTLAYNAVFIGGVSTLFFNANPLLRFDGYYIFSDLIEIPNLRQRSTRFLAYLGERFVLGNSRVAAPPATAGERAWFVVYGISSFFYRIAVVIGIVLFVASRFFFVGVLLALWTIVGWLCLPLGRLLSVLFTSPRLRSYRVRSIAAVSTIAGGLALVVCVVPFPLNTVGEGVIWVPERAIVRAGSDGFIEEVLAVPGAEVEVGQPLLRCRDPEVAARARELRARLDELEATRMSVQFEDPVQAEVTREEIAHVRSGLERVEQDLELLIIRSRSTGVFVLPNAADYVGVFVRRGTPVARVIDLSIITARVVVEQADVDLVRHRTERVDVRLSERPGATLPALVKREVPGVSEQLPSSALGSAGGGAIASDPTEARGTRALASVFQFDLELPASAGVINVGGRVHVRLCHGSEPLVHRWYRGVRQLFLSRFAV